MQQRSVARLVQCILWMEVKRLKTRLWVEIKLYLRHLPPGSSRPGSGEAPTSPHQQSTQPGKPRRWRSAYAAENGDVAILLLNSSRDCANSKIWIAQALNYGVLLSAAREDSEPFLLLTNAAAASVKPPNNINRPAVRMPKVHCLSDPPPTIA